MNIISRHSYTLMLWISTVLISQTDPSLAQKLDMVVIDSLLQNATVYTLNQDYERALTISADIIARAPEQPLGHLFHAATLQSRMLDFENTADEEAFMKHLKACRQLSENLLRRNPDHAHAHFWLGSAYGYESFYLGKKRRYLEAVHLGWKTIQHLETAVRLDPKLYDAYLGIGTYKYYRSKMKLLFWGDETAEGLALVRQAAKHGKYSCYAALNGLIWMLLDENLADEAYATADSVLQKFPRSRFFLWGAAESATRLEKFARARECYAAIMASLQEEKKLSPYLAAVCRLKLARLALKESNPQNACAELDLIEAKDLPRDSKGKDLAKQIEQMRKSCAASQASSNGRHDGQ